MKEDSNLMLSQIKKLISVIVAKKSNSKQTEWIEVIL